MIASRPLDRRRALQPGDVNPGPGRVEPARPTETERRNRAAVTPLGTRCARRDGGRRLRIGATRLGHRRPTGGPKVWAPVPVGPTGLVSMQNNAVSLASSRTRHTAAVGACSVTRSATLRSRFASSRTPRLLASMNVTCRMSSTRTVGSSPTRRCSWGAVAASISPSRRSTPSPASWTTRLLDDAHPRMDHRFWPGSATSRHPRATPAGHWCLTRRAGHHPCRSVR